MGKWESPDAGEHASMIALGIAQNRPDKKVICIDGDGAALMHMGCRRTEFARIAEAAGYHEAKKLETMEEIDQIGRWIDEKDGPVFWEVPVTLDSRADLGRPKESAGENKEEFRRFLDEL